MEGKSLQVEGVQRAPERPVSQVSTKQKVPTKEKKQSMVAGWSTEKMEEKASKQEFKDTEDMVQWRSTNQENIETLRKKVSENIENEVLKKYNVEVSKRGASKEEGEPSESRMVQRVEKYQPRKWDEGCWASIFSWFREYNLQRKQGMQKKETRQQRMKVMKDMTGKIRAKGRWMRTTVGGSASCWPLIAKKHWSIQDGKTQCRNGMIGFTK